MKNFTEIFDINEARETKEFVMIKPGFLHLTQTLIGEMKAVGLIPVRWNTKTLSRSEAKRFYEPHKAEDFYNDLCDYMSSGASTGFEVINTKQIDLGKWKDDIRKKYGVSDMKNVIHSSDSANRKIIERNIYLKK